MMEIAPTTSFKFIREAVIDPYVWRWACDDLSPRPDMYFPPINGNTLWLKLGEYGVVTAWKLQPSVFEVHVALNSTARGRAFSLCLKALEWFQKNTTPPYTLVANIPEHNFLAVKLAEKIGFKYTGPAPSILKNGRLQNRSKYILREEKEE